MMVALACSFIAVLLASYQVLNQLDSDANPSNDSEIRESFYNKLIAQSKRHTSGIISSPNSDLQEVQRHHQIIMAEYMEYLSSIKHEGVKVSSFEFLKQKTLWLKFYGEPMDIVKSGEHFPKTMELVNNAQMSSAFISTLEAGENFHPHIGYTAGVWRYHLGLKVDERNQQRTQFQTPIWVNDGEKRPPVHLAVQNNNILSLTALNSSKVPWYVFHNESEYAEKYSADLHAEKVSDYRKSFQYSPTDIELLRRFLARGWVYHEYKTGSHVLWDDNNIHYAQNGLDSERTILLGDVGREDLNLILRGLNWLILHVVAKLLPEVSGYIDAINLHQKNCEEVEMKGAVPTTMQRMMDKVFVDSGGRSS